MVPQTVIHTIRHAQTTFGAENRYAGSIDVPLSAKGEQSCLEAGAALAAVPFDIVVTSTLRRAIDTARLLAGDREIRQTELCRERCFGVMEGLTWDAVQKLDPPVLFIEVGGDRHSVNPSDGEPFEDVWGRAKAFRRLLLDEYAGRQVLVVSHGVFLQMFHGVLRGSNCIESLGVYPANLELASFELVGERLEREEVRKLVRMAGQRF